MALNVNINVQTESLRSTDNQVRQAQRHDLSRKTDQAKTTEKASKLILPQSQQNPKTPPNARPSAPSTTNPKSPTNSSGSSLILTPTASSYASPIQRPQRVSQQLSARRKGGKLEGARYVEEARSDTDLYWYRTPGRFPGGGRHTAIDNLVQFYPDGGPYDDPYMQSFETSFTGSVRLNENLYTPNFRHAREFTIQGWFNNEEEIATIANFRPSTPLYFTYSWGDFSLTEYGYDWQYSAQFWIKYGAGAGYNFSFEPPPNRPRPPLSEVGVLGYGSHSGFVSSEDNLNVSWWYLKTPIPQGWNHYRVSHVDGQLRFFFNDQEIPLFDEDNPLLPRSDRSVVINVVNFSFSDPLTSRRKHGQTVLSTGDYAKIDANNPTSQRSNRIREVRP